MESGRTMKAAPPNDRCDLNCRIARANREDFDAAGLKVLSMVGPAGSGKTTAIEALLMCLEPKIRVAVMVGGLAASRQVSRLTRHGYHAVPLITDQLTAAIVRDSLGRLDLNDLDLLVIEADGNAFSPIEVDLGHHMRVSVFSVAGGDDKATEHPFLVAASHLVLLTKADLLPFVTFDLRAFYQDVERAKPNMPIIQVSIESNQRVGQWVQWVESHLSPHTGGVNAAVSQQAIHHSCKVKGAI